MKFGVLFMFMRAILLFFSSNGNSLYLMDCIHHFMQGQYKSTLVCPICRKVSVTFDPFMYLSLPLPSTTMRTMTITVVSGSGDKMSPLSPYTISVPKNGRFEDLTRALSIACSLGTDETLLVAEVYFL